MPRDFYFHGMMNSTSIKPPNTLPAEERIKSRKLFDELFLSGKSIVQSPFRVLWKEIPFEEKNPVQLGVTAPKRKMRQANHRNRMKRLMREAYRLNKHELVELCKQQQKGLAILFISQCTKPTTFVDTQDKIILLLQRLIRQHAPVVE